MLDLDSLRPSKCREVFLTLRIDNIAFHARLLTENEIVVTGQFAGSGIPDAVARINLDFGSFLFHDKSLFDCDTLSLGEVKQQVFLHLIFVLDVKGSVHLLVSPIQVLVKLQQLQHFGFFEHLASSFVVAATDQCLHELATNVLVDTKIDCEIETSEFLNVETVEGHVHLELLSLVEVVGLVFKITIFVLSFKVLMQESKHHRQLLLVGLK